MDRTWRVESLPNLSANYDVLVGALGYESRSRHIPLMLADRSTFRWAASFDEQNELAWAENRQALVARGFVVDVVNDSEFRQKLTHILAREATRPTGNVKHVCIDISSMSRRRIACALLACLEHASAPPGAPWMVDFCYSPAKYFAAPEIAPAISIFEPVLPEFAGWSSAPELPIGLVLGLGVEPDRALGVVERFEPGRVWAFRSIGFDQDFDRDLQLANRALLGDFASEAIVGYRLTDPLATFVMLESLAAGAKRDFRVCIVPFGPKIFTLISLLVASMHQPDIAVWRVSSANLAAPIDVQASEQVVGVRLVFGTHAGAISGAAQNSS